MSLCCRLSGRALERAHRPETGCLPTPPATRARAGHVPTQPCDSYGATGPDHPATTDPTNFLNRVCSEDEPQRQSGQRAQSSGIFSSPLGSLPRPRYVTTPTHGDAPEGIQGTSRCESRPIRPTGTLRVPWEKPAASPVLRRAAGVKAVLSGPLQPLEPRITLGQDVGRVSCPVAWISCVSHTARSALRPATPR